MRDIINILREAEMAEPMASDAPDEVTRLTDEWVEQLIGYMQRAKFGIDREWSHHGYTVEAFQRYADLKGQYRSMKLDVTTENGMSYPSSITITKLTPLFTADRLRQMTLDEYRHGLEGLATLMRRTMMGYGVANRMQAFGAGMLNATGIPGLRKQRRMEK